MISNSDRFQPQLIKPNQPVLTPQRISHAQALPALRFGAKDTATTTSSLPEWTQQVKDPAVTQNQLLEDVMDITLNKDKKSTMKGAIWKTFKVFYKSLVTEPRAKRKEKQYLPKQAKSDLRNYHWSLSFWWNRIFNSKKAKLMEVVYQGPIAIKAKQQEVQSILDQKASFEEGLQLLSKAKATNPIFGPLHWAANRIHKKQLKEAETYGSLRNNVPPLPYKKLEKQIKALQSAYNKAHPGDPIESVEKDALKAGSIAQVYLATTKSKKKLVLKVIKPNITESFLDEYRPYLYYKNLLSSGCKPQEKQKAAQEAQTTVGLLKEEIHPSHETDNTRKIREWIKRLEPIGVTIPDILTHSKEGLILPFVGDKDVADLSDKEQIALKQKIGPDVARFLLLASAKPLDIHDGNMRSDKAGEPAQWIDHGRQFNISEANHQKLLQLMVDTFKAPKASETLSPVQNALLQKDVRQKLKALLEINPTANQQALNNLKALDNLGNIKNQAIKLSENWVKLHKNLALSIAAKQTRNPAAQAELKKALLTEAQEQELIATLKTASDKLKAYDNATQLLSQLLGQPQTSKLQEKALRKQFKNKDLEIKAAPLSVLNAWASTALTLPGFANNPLTMMDVEQYQDKMRGFIQPALRDTDTKPTDTEEALKTRRQAKLLTLATGLADALTAQTKMSIDKAARARLIETLKNGMAADLDVEKSAS